MNVSIEVKRTEAIMRMKALGIFPMTIQQFEYGDHVSISMPPAGAFFWAEGEDLERIKRFESEHNALVYVVIRSYTSIGKMDSMLFVSDHPENWAMDRIDLMLSQATAYVHIFATPDRSGLGSIGIAGTIGAGLRMTWYYPRTFDSCNIMDVLANLWQKNKKSLGLDTKEQAITNVPQLRPSHRGLTGIKKDDYPLPEELRKFNYYYYLDGAGHVVMAIPESLLPQAIKSGNFDDYECPIPCRYILAKGYRFHDGYVVCDAPYSKELGVDIDESWYDM